MAAEAPNSYRAPYWADLASNTETKLGLPAGLLVSVLTNGERSNADQVSEANARTPFQVTPATRNLVLKRDGIDAYLSPENAAEVAGIVLKDGLGWAKSRTQDPEMVTKLAAGYYHGGGDKANWGPRTESYIARVSAGMQPIRRAALDNDFARWMAANPAVPTSPPSPAGQAPGPAAPASTANDALDRGFADYLAGTDLPPGSPLGDRASVSTERPAPGPRAAGLGERLAAMPGQIAESVTGSERSVPATEALPEWTQMPELTEFTIPGMKTGIGTLLSSTPEAVQIVQANFPNVQVSQDEKGNPIFTSAIDGKQYAIKPGLRLSDLPRVMGGAAAFSPAGAARTIGGAVLGAGATQAAIEASQAATGGEFSPGAVAMAGATGGVVPAAGNLIRATAKPAQAMLARVRGLPDPAGAALEAPAAVPGARVAPSNEAPAATGAVTFPVKPTAPAPASAGSGQQMIWRSADSDIPVLFKHVEPQVGPDGRMYARVEANGRESFVPADELVAAPGGAKPAPGNPAAAPVAPMSGPELAQTAKKAAEGGRGAKAATQTLAEQAAPNAKTVEAAKRLGIEDHLQPDHVTTSQAYRELAQAVKSVPGSEAHAAELAGLEKVGRRADDLIHEIGGTSDVSALDASVKSRMQGTQAELERQAEKLYGKVRAAIPAKTAAPADNTLGFLKQHADEVGGEARLLPTERKLLSALDGDGSPLTYAYLDQVRKQIGQAMRKASGPFADSESGMLKKLYGTLSQDQMAVAETVGAGDLYRAASASVAVRKGLEDDMTSLFGKELTGSLVGPLSTSVRALPGGDASKLIRLLSAVPPEMRQEVAASGLASAFRTAGTRGPIGFGQFEKWYDGLLRNKQAHAALMANLPIAARKRISDLYRVSKGISAATKERITTGRIQAVQEQFKAADTLAGKLYEAAKRGAVGATVGTVATPIFGPGVGAALASTLTKGARPAADKAVDALIASPQFLQAVKAAGTPAQAAAVRSFAYSKQFIEFVRAIGGHREMSNRERWVLQALQTRHNLNSRPHSSAGARLVDDKGAKQRDIHTVVHPALGGAGVGR
jgi:hypothetical protein